MKINMKDTLRAMRQKEKITQEALAAYQATGVLPEPAKYMCNDSRA